MQETLRIGITDCSKFDNYRRWIEMTPGMVAVKLSMHLQNVADADQCDGVVFSGGEDVQPILYGKPEFEQEFDLKEILPAFKRLAFRIPDFGKTPFRQKPYSVFVGVCRSSMSFWVAPWFQTYPVLCILLHTAKKMERIRPIWSTLNQAPC